MPKRRRREGSPKGHRESSPGSQNCSLKFKVEGLRIAKFRSLKFKEGEDENPWVRPEGEKQPKG